MSRASLEASGMRLAIFWSDYGTITAAFQAHSGALDICNLSIDKCKYQGLTPAMTPA